MRIIIYIALLLISINIPAFSATATEEAKPAATAAAPTTEKTSNRVTSKNGDVNLVLPDKWEVMDQNLGLDLVALAPAVKPDDLFRQNLNVISIKMDTPLSLDEYYGYNVESLRELLENFDLENSQNVTIGGSPAKKIVFTHTVGPVNVKVIQYLTIVGKKAYVVTFTADTLSFDKYNQAFDDIAKSVQFKPEAQKLTN